jgi:hypothetical protein
LTFSRAERTSNANNSIKLQLFTSLIRTNGYGRAIRIPIIGNESETRQTTLLLLFFILQRIPGYFLYAVAEKNI